MSRDTTGAVDKGHAAPEGEGATRTTTMQDTTGQESVARHDAGAIDNDIRDTHRRRTRHGEQGTALDANALWTARNDVATSNAPANNYTRETVHSNDKDHDHMQRTKTQNDELRR